ncbi:hypothetical protein [Allopontixanthobacter sediminis]|uniref:Uncharacterized protein n=1 Tax=Allopontixanthobacter sediminis TaxID=1689985 RepID=A0A845AZD4_9SPHN|nr:hypothetical protein [Allopontixanthobacter sediminis]MXP44853.1 hypothetical protein [Allopontixanthobacter sediminis]
MIRFAIGTALLTISVAASAQDTRPVLWDQVRAGMTVSEVRAAYPERGGKVKWHKAKQTEIEDVTILEGCEAEVEIHHESGTVDAVKVKGKGSLGGRCSDKVLGALSAKYGQPMVQRAREQSILAREGEIVVWNKDGITMRFKQFTNGAFGGAGLGQSSWELAYTASASEIAL